MRIGKTTVTAFGLVLSLALGTWALAQTQQETWQTVQTDVKVTAEKGLVTVAKSGGAGGQTATWTFVASEMGFESKVIKGVPFSADAVTEFTQTLSTGQRIHRKSTTSMYRDSEGRTRREQTINAIGPYASSGPPKQTIFINDPVAGTSYVLNPADHTAMVTRVTSVGTGSEAGKVIVTHEGYNVAVGGAFGGTVVKPGGGGGGFGAAGTGGVVVIGKDASTNSRTESLGTQTVEGVPAEGTRTIETIPTGSIGNDSPIEIVTERWYSSEMGMLIKSKTSNPMSGDNLYQLTNIKRAEPDPSLFQVPADYAVKETSVIKTQIIKKDSDK